MAEAAEVDVTGAALTITFSEELSESTDGPPAASAFSLAGTSATATSVSIEANAVALQLSPAAREGDSIVLSYDAPPVGGLADADQGQIPVAMFSLIVGNRTDTAPALQHGAVADDLITLTFDQPLDATSVPPVIEQGLSPSNSITVTVDQIRVSFTAVAVDGRELRLTLASPVRAGAQVRVQYQLGTASPLGDASMPPNLIDSFDPFELTNVTPAAPLSAEIVGWTLRVAFDAPLMSQDAIATAGFGVAADASDVVVNGISANGAILVLHIATPVATGVAVTLTYEPPFEAALFDTDGSAVRAFALSVGNLTGRRSRRVYGDGGRDGRSHRVRSGFDRRSDALSGCIRGERSAGIGRRGRRKGAPHHVRRGGRGSSGRRGRLRPFAVRRAAGRERHRRLGVRARGDQPH